ncbi:NAD(P)H-binding protein [Sabulicella rubraurantiaca]|uniref:NAD(P)H-binding protein n=1 Tax=Sabulicella rubraurantiaca TaxID=2811429 RepID=UPI001A95D564|nr:NADH-ubiquinone oxidoreductase [Sabulicella rubraurantiaca]
MIALIGATGRSGAVLARALDRPFRAVVRDAARWRALGIEAPHAVAPLEDGPALAKALEGAELVVSCAHARHAPAILAATRVPVVLMGSTRRHSRWPDAHGDGVRAGEAAFLADGRPGVMLHPTMIYGAQGENNVQRLAALMRRLPALPLPGGGRALVQPIHQSDVTRSLLAAIGIAHEAPRVLIVAGPEALPYREFCAEVARAAGYAPRPVLPVPAGLLMAIAPVARLLLPRVGRDEIRRLTEDKAFSISAMREVLGVHPIPLAEGLRLTFA